MPTSTICSEFPPSVLARTCTTVYTILLRPRRQQAPITIQSDWAKERLKLLTRDGRSQVAVIEDGLRRVPIPSRSKEDTEARLAELGALIAQIPKGSIMTMEEFDALEYDENGDLR